MSIRGWFNSLFQGEVPVAFIVPSSEGKRQKVLPEDWDAYRTQRDEVLRDATPEGGTR